MIRNHSCRLVSEPATALLVERADRLSVDATRTYVESVTKPRTGPWKFGRPRADWTGAMRADKHESVELGKMRTSQSREVMRPE